MSAHSSIVRSFALVLALSATISADRAGGQCSYWQPGLGVPGVFGSAWTLVSWDPDGAGPAGPVLVVGGGFTQAGNIPVYNLATWNGTTWQTFGAGANNVVRSAIVWNGDLVLGGDFQTVDGVSGNHVIRRSGTTWLPLGSGTDNSVNALTVWNGSLVAAGTFSNAGGASANNIALWNGSIWQSLGSGTSGGVPNGRVNALCTFGPDLVAAGDFTSAGGASANRIARWNGTTWQPFAGGFQPGVGNWGVGNVAVFNNELYAAGGFISADGNSNIKGLARWDGATWQAVGSLSNASHISLTVFGGQLVIDGYWLWNGTSSTTLQPQKLCSPTVEYQGRLYGSSGGTSGLGQVVYHDGTYWQPAGTGADGSITASLPYGEKLVLGGSFQVNGGKYGPQIVLSTAGGCFPLWPYLTPSCADCAPNVRTMTQLNSDLIVGGIFNGPGHNVARWDGENWSALGSGIGNPEYPDLAYVDALAVYNGKLYAGGWGIYMTRWDDPQWFVMGPFGVFCMKVYRGELILGGDFPTIEGTTMNHIARFDGTNWLPMGSGMDGRVTKLTTFNGDLIALGDFTTAGGQGAFHIARWDGHTWHGLAGIIHDGAGTGTLSAAAEYRGSLYAGGKFTDINGVSANNVARWDGSTWSALGSGTGTVAGNDPSVFALNEFNGDLDVEGAFYLAGGNFSCSRAQWHTDFAVTQHPQSQEACPGSPFTLSATAISPDSIAYQWRKNGNNLSDDGRISGSHTASLSFNTLNAGDAGQYDLRITSSACGSMTSIPANITTAPTINTAPITPQVCAGSPATLSVTAEGLGTLSYHWRRNGQNLSDGGHYSGVLTSTLTINPFQVADAGSFDVVVTDTCASQTSSPVNASPRTGPLVNQQPVPTVGCQSQQASLLVFVDTLSTPTYQWRKGGVNLNDGGGISGTHSGTLVFNPVQAAHAGSYDVLITDTCGTTTSQSVLFSTETAPQVTQQPATQVKCIGELASFHVSVNGAPPVTYRWRKNGVNLNDGGNISGATTSTVTINPVTAGSDGSFDCVIMDNCSQVTSNTASLTIPSGPPSFLSSPMSLDICAGQELFIGGFAVSNPSPTYQWMKNGQPIPGATSPDLDIVVAAAGDSGVYVLVAMNGCYSASSDPATVNVFANGGDGNLDTKTNGLDVPGFIAALTDWDGNYTAPYCAYDLNADAYVDLGDLGPFVNLLLAQ